MEDILNQISKDKMNELLVEYSKIDRLSGSIGEKKAIDYLTDKLKEYNIPYENNEFEAYLSNPIVGKLQIISPVRFEFAAKTRSFSGNYPEGVVGELVYVPAVGDILDQRAQITWKKEDVAGKIIVSEGGSPQHIEKAEDLGAIGLIHVWPSEENVIHEMIASPVWGTPTPETVRQLPRIPEISIKNSDGMELIELVKKGKVKAKLITEVETGVKKLNLPVAYIPGKTEEYVLLAGHIDSWYVGITDNAVGNALCLELARVFAPYAGKIKRGIKIAWWPGHSNGRYAGSTWYADNFWQDLHENCIAYVNSDSPGSKNGVNTLIRTTLLEEPKYFDNIVEKVTGVKPRWDFPMRAGDNSLWGTGIPFHIMLRDEPDDENAWAKVGGSGGGWWWHSEEDTYDKADLSILERDAKINGAMVWSLANEEVIPINLKAFASIIEKVIKDIIEDSDEEFDFSSIIDAIDEFKDIVNKFTSFDKKNTDKLNRLYKNVGGQLSQLMYSYSSPYYHDAAYAQKPFPSFQRIRKMNRVNTSEEKLLFFKTDFIRQRNRFVNEISRVIKDIKYFMNLEK